ncbi:hypothetical protein CANCADRAFT_111100 [Tortispora caseinolytica NRRL Y-17796]|uniref:2-(3-amino-3-carboxypropyl)histidine synthase subunit 2 n=1 Tax=Tortispora caseinolytica NRRL Y-17796 TaxID=767744 RepID=A0A1E4TGG6_9ASCO|nr:hypothetical protein CANCADRAFT_111100 [Tortispora caseinolytica NRRL Y-17796]
MSAAPVLATEPEYSKVNVQAKDHDLTKYDLPNLVKVLESYSSIALQFPDDMLPDAPLICREIGEKAFVLADTSYSACCIDITAASHANADVIVHFGDACFSPISGIHVVWACGIESPDTAAFEATLESLDADHIAVMGNASYEPFILSWSDSYSGSKSILPIVHSGTPHSETEDRIRSPPLDHTLPPSEVLPHHSHHSADLNSYALVYIGDAPNSVLLHLSTLFASLHVYDVNACTLHVPQTQLQKRFKATQIAKHASTIGILVNSLSLSDRLDILESTKEIVAAAGKKSYTFVVGKVTVAKLANFEVVDVWVVLGCGYGGINFLLNSSDFYKPLVTPYELHLALQPGIVWPGLWLTDFGEILRLQKPQIDESDEPAFNPVTGSLVSSAPLRTHIAIDAEPESALASKLEGHLVIGSTVSTASERLKSRLWSGLGTDYDSQDYIDRNGSVAGQGRAGIARDYGRD